MFTQQHSWRIHKVWCTESSHRKVGAGLPNSLLVGFLDIDTPLDDQRLNDKMKRIKELKN